MLYQRERFVIFRERERAIERALYCELERPALLAAGLATPDGDDSGDFQLHAKSTRKQGAFLFFFFFLLLLYNFTTATTLMRFVAANAVNITRCTLNSRNEAQPEAT